MEHSYFKCAVAGCGRIDRQDYIRQRFLSAGIGCRYCSGKSFYDVFRPSEVERSLVKQGRFSSPEIDPYEPETSI